MNTYQDGHFDTLCAGFKKWICACYAGKHSACRGCGLNSPAVSCVHVFEHV